MVCDNTLSDQVKRKTDSSNIRNDDVKSDDVGYQD